VKERRCFAEPIYAEICRRRFRYSLETLNPMNHHKGEIVQMMRKGLYTILIVCLLAMAPASVALAQRPEPPTPDLAAAGDMPETVQQAVALQESLTAEQHAAVRAILDKHLPDLEAASEALVAALGAPPDASMGKMSASADIATRGEPAAAAAPVDRELMVGVQAVLQAIDADMAGVLDADQLALYRAVMNPEFAAAPDAAGPDAAGAPGAYTTNCYWGAYYNAGTEAYAWLSYVYGYYDYYYYGGYYYAFLTYYYAYQTYSAAVNALRYSAPVYFTYYFFGQYTSGYPYNAYDYSYWTEYYGYRAWFYGYYNYYYYGSGSGYGWYAYYYGYQSFYGGDYGHYYTYYCYVYS
jgi:hypothetical protein